MLDTKSIILITVGSVLLLGLVGSSIYMYESKQPLQAQLGISETVAKAFAQWKKQYNKNYSSVYDNTYRLTVFNENYKNIQAINMNKSKTYKAALNQFSDMTLEEFKSIILMRVALPPRDPMMKTYQKKNIKAAASIDWRTKGAVTPIKDQAQCGSCWSFSTTGVLEGTAALFGKGLQSLSEQQLVDCCGSEGFQCEGCSGAWPQWAVNYVEAKGITTEDQYPYTGVDGTCQDSSKTMTFKVSKQAMITAGAESDLVDAVNTQPVSICVDASTWFSYSSGVFSDCNASPSLDHAVLLVGYTADYYIVKNSWNTSWGNEGYIWLPKGTNACGLANNALTTSI